MIKYLHTMIRVTDLEKSLHFYCQGLGFELVSRSDHAEDRFTLVFLRSPDDRRTGASGQNEPMLELTHNWDTKSYDRGNAYGHVAYQVDSIENVREKLRASGYDLSWGPGMTPSGTRKMAFVDDPDGYEIELLEG